MATSSVSFSYGSDSWESLKRDVGQSSFSRIPPRPEGPLDIGGTIPGFTPRGTIQSAAPFRPETFPIASDRREDFDRLDLQESQGPRGQSEDTRFLSRRLPRSAATGDIGWARDDLQSFHGRTRRLDDESFRDSRPREFWPPQSGSGMSTGRRGLLEEEFNPQNEAEREACVLIRAMANISDFQELVALATFNHAENIWQRGRINPRLRLILGLAILAYSPFESNAALSAPLRETREIGSDSPFEGYSLIRHRLTRGLSRILKEPGQFQARALETIELAYFLMRYQEEAHSLTEHSSLGLAAVLHSMVEMINAESILNPRSVFQNTQLIIRVGSFVNRNHQLITQSRPRAERRERHSFQDMFELTQDDYETISLLMDQVIPYLSRGHPHQHRRDFDDRRSFRSREPRDIPTTEARTSLRGIVPTLGQKTGSDPDSESSRD